MKNSSSTILILLLLAALLSACSPNEGASSEDKLNVVATTTIVGDVVAQVGGDSITLHILLPVGVDPHSFDPSPQDIAMVANANVVFVNGAGLEVFLEKLIESAGAQEKVVQVSEGIDFLKLVEAHPEDAGTTGHEGIDPHTWTDPNNVIVWVANIERALSQLDPANAQSYAANAKEYITELQSLDAWVREQVAQIPSAERKIVTDHTLFNYFADEYGFTQIGALIPGFSTLAEPTAKEQADLEDAIQNLDVKAVFVGNTVNPTMAERVAEDTGIQLVFLYTGSLSKANGEAASYLDYIRYNVNAFVQALK